ncbi:MAG: hypothetical protein D6778_00620, partial [Nitrospirae bacterium]
MEIEMLAGNKNQTIEVPNPYRADIKAIGEEIRNLVGSEMIDGLDVEGLIKRMIKGVYGCEQGCPADAKSLVREGYGPFKLQYIEGGILAAEVTLASGQS